MVFAQVRGKNWYFPVTPNFFPSQLRQIQFEDKVDKEIRVWQEEAHTTEIQFKRESHFNPYLKYRHLSHTLLYLFIVTWICIIVYSFREEFERYHDEHRYVAFNGDYIILVAILIIVIKLFPI